MSYNPVTKPIIFVTKWSGLTLPDVATAWLYFCSKSPWRCCSLTYCSRNSSKCCCNLATSSSGRGNVNNRTTCCTIHWLTGSSHIGAPASRKTTLPCCFERRALPPLVERKHRYFVNYFTSLRILVVLLRILHDAISILLLSACSPCLWTM